MREIRKGWQEFWAEFFRIKHRHRIKNIRNFDRKLVSHMIEVLQLERGSRVLDLGCGGGDQALELARKGMTVVGIDIAHSLMDYGNRAARKENLKVELIQGDMREQRFTKEFDACVILSGSFGFFDDEGNLGVLRVIQRALEKGGKFYIHGPNPLKRIRKGWKGWDEVESGYLLMESNYNPISGKTIDNFFYITDKGELIKFRAKPEDEGFSLETRFYTLPEMVGLIKTANLQFRNAYGSIELPPEEYGITSKALIVIGEKP